MKSTRKQSSNRSTARLGRSPFRLPACAADRDAVWANIDGERYALNGTAQTHKDFPPLPRNLWRDDPEIPGAKVSLYPLIRAGLRLC
ncbi:MAG: DUF2511 domain-containing protein [Chloroflexi bacterium]|nr:DUF2511 domain-containing protein [Chloroflexota bacterium]